MDCINKTTSFSIQKAAVIGAGTMGAGIAALVADAGIPVILLDIVPPKLTEEDVIKGVDTKAAHSATALPKAARNGYATPSGAPSMTRSTQL